jgi:hypothetical protein
VRSALLVVVVQTALALLAMSQEVVKSVIHGGFAPLLKSAINRVSVHEFSSQIFLMM